jgi:hypothetical protein
VPEISTSLILLAWRTRNLAMDNTTGLRPRAEITLYKPAQCSVPTGKLSRRSTKLRPRRSLEVC